MCGFSVKNFIDAFRKEVLSSTLTTKQFYERDDLRISGWKWGLTANLKLNAYLQDWPHWITPFLFGYFWIVLMLMEGKLFRQNRTFKFLILIAILIVCFLMGRYFHIDYDYYRTLLSKYPPVISGFIFISLYVGVTTFAWFGPKDVFRVVGAILFGPVMSTVCIYISEMANAAILFYFVECFRW